MMPLTGPTALLERLDCRMVHDDGRHVVSFLAADFERLHLDLANQPKTRQSSLVAALEQPCVLGDLVVQQVHGSAGVEDQAIGPLAVDFHHHRHVPALEELERHNDRLWCFIGTWLGSKTEGRREQNDKGQA